MFIHPRDHALAKFDRAFCLAARFADHGLAHGPVVRLRVAEPQLFAGRVGFIEAARFDEINDASGEPVEVGLDEAASMMRCRWRGIKKRASVAMPGAVPALPAADARALPVSADFRRLFPFVTFPGALAGNAATSR